MASDDLKSKYLKNFREARQSIKENRLRTKKNHIQHYEDIEEMLGFQYYLNINVTKYFYNIPEPRKEQLNMSMWSEHLLFFYNVHSVESALYPLECDFLHASANSLRTVHEAIPKMYYISLFPEEIEDIMVHEEIHMLKYEDALQALQGEDCQAYLGDKTLEFPTKTQFQKFKTKYSPLGFRNALYDETRKNAINSFYGKLSNSSHANITRNRTSTTYDPVNTNLFFDFIKSYCYFNIEAYLEGNFKLLYELKLSDEILSFLNTHAQKKGTITENVFFMPNKDDLKQRMNTKPDAKNNNNL